MDRPVDTWNGISGAAFAALAEQYGTPFYLYDADAMRARIARIRSRLEGLAGVFYAVKANPNLALLRALKGAADGLDISSGGELEQALLAGFEGPSLSFAGPAKTDAELAAAMRRGVGCISIESPRELAACIDIAGQLGVKANVGLRINPRLLNRGFGLKMGGKAIQFGIDEEELWPVLERVRKASAQLDFRGVHVYAGSQCFEAAAIAEGAADVLRMVREIEGTTGLHCPTVNLGGGFGVAHGEADRALDLDELADRLLPLLQDFHRGGERKVVFELGRYIAAEAGIYVTRIVGSKVSRGVSFFMADGGLNHHLAAAGTFGAALRSNFALRNLSRPGADPLRCSIAGPSCNPTDLLAIDVELPRLEEGDLLGVLKSGSYGFSASPLLFLGRRTPAELVKREGVVSLGRRGRSVSEFN